jgi:hypothetical protein
MSLRVLLLGLALVVVGACSSASSASSAASAAPSPAASSAPSSAVSGAGSGALAVVELRGGECVAAATCDTVITLDADGRIHLAAKPPNDLGTTSPAQVQALETAIAAADFAALRKPAFSGTCPTAYDGQELIFTFTTANGSERLASCESTLDYSAPVFKALAAALGTNSPMGSAQ